MLHYICIRLDRKEIFVKLIIGHNLLQEWKVNAHKADEVFGRRQFFLAQQCLKTVKILQKSKGPEGLRQKCLIDPLVYIKSISRLVIKSENAQLCQTHKIIVLDRVYKIWY
jgi:hypothetical protein